MNRDDIFFSVWLLAVFIVFGLMLLKALFRRWYVCPNCLTAIDKSKVMSEVKVCPVCWHCW